MTQISIFATMLVTILSLFSHPKAEYPVAPMATNEAGYEADFTCNYPRFKANTVTYKCQRGNTCGTWLVTTARINAVSFGVGNNCMNNTYNFYGNPVYYTLYKYQSTTGGYEIYTKIHSFSCIQPSVVIARSDMTNNTKFALFVNQNQPSPANPTTVYRKISNNVYYATSTGTDLNKYPEDIWNFSTQNYAGSSCNK